MTTSRNEQDLSSKYQAVNGCLAVFVTPTIAIILGFVGSLFGGLVGAAVGVFIAVCAGLGIAGGGLQGNDGPDASGPGGDGQAGGPGPDVSIPPEATEVTHSPHSEEGRERRTGKKET